MLLQLLQISGVDDGDGQLVSWNIVESAFFLISSVTRDVDR